MPETTVLMAVRNDERHIEKATASILQQTEKNFEFLIINDASTDGTIRIINNFADPRIRILTNRERIGLTRSLNMGLQEARGQYVARMDGDDVSYPTRLEKQIAFLKSNPACGLVGTVFFRRFRVRREPQLLAAERARMQEGATFGIKGIRELMARDAAFREYQLAMSMFGAGMLSLTPLMVVCQNEVLGLPAFQQVLVTTAIPVLVVPFAVQPWASYLDRHRVLAFRAVHGRITIIAEHATIASGHAQIGSNCRFIREADQRRFRELSRRRKEFSAPDRMFPGPHHRNSLP